MTVRIAIDCMGGDHGLSVTIPAALAFLRRVPDAHCTLVGREEDIRLTLAGQLVNPSIAERFRVHHASKRPPRPCAASGIPPCGWLSTWSRKGGLTAA
jgi:fatty acid/phospholipid biosynthesis enzyme